MKIDDLASKHDQAKIFNLEYEFRINRLKLDYITVKNKAIVIYYFRMCYNRFNFCANSKRFCY